MIVTAWSFDTDRGGIQDRDARKTTALYFANSPVKDTNECRKGSITLSLVPFTDSVGTSKSSGVTSVVENNKPIQDVNAFKQSRVTNLNVLNELKKFVFLTKNFKVKQHIIFGTIE